MARRISTGVVGRNVLGALTTENNVIASVVTDQDILLQPSGQGRVVSDANFLVADQQEFRLGDSQTPTNGYVAFKSPTTISSNYTLTFPDTAGTSGYVLTTNGSGTLSWENVAVQVGDDIAGDTSTNYYPMMTSSTSGGITEVKIVSSKLIYDPDIGQLSTTKFVETSSIALKENISPIENALESLSKLVGVTYDRKDGSAKMEAGLIAEEVDKVLPNIVAKDEEGNPYGINYTKFSAYLIEAVKTLSREIETLKRDKYS
jgi:hypothetical protein